MNTQPFVLPSLPYPYDALKPHIDETTMLIHHTKHHQGYVNKLNAALKNIPQAPTSLELLLKQVDSYNIAVRNNAGGHYNHTFFWESMSPKPLKVSTSQLSSAFSNDFGSFTFFQEQFTTQATSLFGSGWTWLCVTSAGKLVILNTPNQDNPLMDSKASLIPILGLDIWEHAYYLQYQNRRKAYIQAFWNVIDWSVIAKRYRKAIQTRHLG